jgi:carbon starvation protein
MGKARYAWMTILPLTWLSIVTLTAGWLKIFADSPKLGFLSHARMLGDFVAKGALPPGVASLDAARRMMFNDRVDAAVAAFFLISVIVILVDSIRVWSGIISGRVRPTSTEVEYIPTAVYPVRAVS